MELERLLNEEKAASEAADEVCRGVKLHMTYYSATRYILQSWCCQQCVSQRASERSVCSLCMQYGSAGRRLLRSLDCRGMPYSIARPTVRAYTVERRWLNWVSLLWGGVCASVTILSRPSAEHSTF